MYEVFKCVHYMCVDCKPKSWRKTAKKYMYMMYIYTSWWFTKYSLVHLWLAEEDNGLLSDYTTNLLRNAEFVLK